MIARHQLCFVLGAALALAAATTARSKESINMHAQGSFDVTVQPQTADNAQAKSAGVSRLSLDKRFHGALEGPSQGEMLAIGGGGESGAYVALERFTGALDGRHGGFALMHSSGMRNGKPENWSVTVVPGSGTEQLAGIEGTMLIRIADGKHDYEFEYTLP